MSLIVTTMMTNRFRQSAFRACALVVLCSASAMVAAQSSQPKPSPTPRRPLPKPVAARGFDQFATRDASARLIAAAATREIIDPGDHYSIGVENYKAGKYEAAVAELKEAIKASPEWDEPYYVLALSLTELGKLNEAVSAFKTANFWAVKDDLRILSYYNLGNVYSDLGFYEDAVRSYKETIKLDPTLSKPHNNLGLADAALGKLSDAAAEFSEAVRLKPDYAEAHYNLGVADLQLGKKKDAQDEQRILVGLKPELATKLNSLIHK